MGKIVKEDIGIIKGLVEYLFRDEKIKAIERLGGLTNHTYKVTIGQDIYAFRLPGKGTKEIIDRRHEKISTKLACELNIDSELVFFDEISGIKISKYILEAQTMSPITMQQHENIILAAKVLYKIHNCAKNTQIHFDILTSIQQYEEFLIKNKVQVYNDYEVIRKEVMKIKEEINKLDSTIVPCHNDPLCENWIKSKDKIYLIDWEYAGMNNALWDVADVSIEACLNEEQEEDLLQAYFQKKVSEKNRKIYLANKIFLDFLWSLWGKTRVPFDLSMEEYAKTRYIRMKQNLKIWKSF